MYDQGVHKIVFSWSGCIGVTLTGGGRAHSPHRPPLISLQALYRFDQGCPVYNPARLSTAARQFEGLR